MGIGPDQKVPGSNPDGHLMLCVLHLDKHFIYIVLVHSGSWKWVPAYAGG